MSRVFKSFEAFAGIGSQHKALSNIFNNNDFNNINYKVVGISEWNYNSIIAYDSIHNGPIDTFERFNSIRVETMLNYISTFTLSKDGKEPYPHRLIEKWNFDNIRQLYIALIRTKSFGSIKDITGASLPRINLLNFSFPCQDISSMGLNAGLGEGTRSGLLWDIKRIIEELNVENKLPKFLLAENVKNIFSDEHFEGWNEFSSFLESLNYKATTLLLNSLDFGIPQSRERFFCIFELNAKTNISVQRKESYIPIKEFLDVDNPIYTNEYKLSIPNNTSSRIKWIAENPNLNIRDYSSTITTKQDRNPFAGYFLCNENGMTMDNPTKDWDINGNKSPYRFLSKREQMLLTGFTSSDYDSLIAANILDSEIEKFAGNSIVVPVLESIFKEIIERF